VAARSREYVRVAGPDAEDFLQRMLSNDVAQAPCPALLLTPKARVIAPLTVVRRGSEDFLLLTEPGLGAAVRSTLLRARFAAKVEIEPEEHSSVVVFGEAGGIPSSEFGEPGTEILDAELEPTLAGEELERMRIEAKVPAWGKEVDDSILPAEAGLDETHISFTKGCYPARRTAHFAFSRLTRRSLGKRFATVRKSSAVLLAQCPAGPWPTCESRCLSTRSWRSDRFGKPPVSWTRRTTGTQGRFQ
jgi:hypothetical protein